MAYSFSLSALINELRQQKWTRRLIIVMVESQVTITYNDGGDTNEGSNCVRIQLIPSPPSS
ncbi:unnamed protein product [Dovyalis caffra]|uniref:Uncharacterized protein n=1 Tax=Dovyalis caffra TaxID=77055 RepID=A0AAV1SE70_9ROSI|nr:unnamed protein product [Dovyalis caffra]